MSKRDKQGKVIEMAALAKSRCYVVEKPNKDFRKREAESYKAFKEIMKEKRPVEERMKELENFLNGCDKL